MSRELKSVACSLLFCSSSRWYAHICGHNRKYTIENYGNDLNLRWMSSIMGRTIENAQNFNEISIKRSFYVSLNVKSLFLYTDQAFACYFSVSRESIVQKKWFGWNFVEKRHYSTWIRIQLIALTKWMSFLFSHFTYHNDHEAKFWRFEYFHCFLPNLHNFNLWIFEYDAAEQRNHTRIWMISLYNFN